MLWETISAAWPWSASRRARSSTIRVWATPSAAVGSSMITSFASQSTAFAIATDCRWPPESEATGWRIERTVVTAQAGERLRSRLSPSPPRRGTRVRSGAPARGTCSARCPGCYRARDPGRRSRFRARRPLEACEFGPGFPSQKIFPCSGAWIPAMRLDRHRLAGAVVADERGHLAGRNFEIDVRERLHRAEVLRDALEAKEGIGAVLGARHRVPSTRSCAGEPGPRPRGRGPAQPALLDAVVLTDLGHLAAADLVDRDHVVLDHRVIHVVLRHPDGLRVHGLDVRVQRRVLRRRVH